MPNAFGEVKGRGNVDTFAIILLKNSAMIKAAAVLVGAACILYLLTRKRWLPATGAAIGLAVGLMAHGIQADRLVALSLLALIVSLGTMRHFAIAGIIGIGLMAPFTCNYACGPEVKFASIIGQISIFMDALLLQIAPLVCAMAAASGLLLVDKFRVRSV